MRQIFDYFGYDWAWVPAVLVAVLFTGLGFGWVWFASQAEAGNELTRIYYTDKVFIDDGVRPTGFYPRVDLVSQPGEGLNVILAGNSWYLLEITAVQQRHKDKFESTVSKVGNDIEAARGNIAIAAKYSGIRTRLQECWQFAKDNGLDPPGDPVELLGSVISC